MLREKLLTIFQVAEILQMNQAVIRKWIREKKIHGIKIGNKWRIRESDLASFLVRVDKKSDSKKIMKNPYAGCYSYPRWIEFSDLPRHLNNLCGKHAWSIFRKLIELDCFYNSDAGQEYSTGKNDLSSVTGLTKGVLERCLSKMCSEKYIKFSGKNKNHYLISIAIPLITPISLKDIDITFGGLKNFPKEQDPGCRKRYSLNTNIQK